MSRWSILLGATAAIAFASISTTGCKNGGGADNLGFFIPPSSLASISSVIPNSGSILGSNSITIIGSNFGAGATARVGDVTLTNIAQPNTFTLTGIIPAGNYTAGAVDVAVATSSQTAILTKGYTFEDMTFTSITPNNGPITGNVPVVIRGTNFKDVPLSGVVLQGTGTNSATIGVLANVVVNSTFDTINAIVLPNLPLGPYNLIITSNSHGVKNFGAVYTVGTGQSTTMLITDIRSQPGNQSPAHGPLAGGTTVTLTADLTAPAPAGFVGGINVTLIYPNGSVLSAANIVIAANFGSLTFTTPAAPTGFFGGPVTIRVDSATQGFATAANGFNYDPANTTPMINSISPALGPQGGGTLVTFQGVNFTSGSVRNVRRVLFGGVAASFVTQSTSQLQAVSPLSPIAGNVSVVVESTTGALSNAITFDYLPSLIITRLNPNNGPVLGGNPITISGANFTTATVISGSFAIGGNPVTNLSVINSSTVTGIVPGATKSVEGPTDVTVAANGGLLGSTLKQGYTYGPSFDDPRNAVTGADLSVSLQTPQGDVRALVVDEFTGTTDAVTVNGPDNSITLVQNVSALNSGSTTFYIPNAAVGNLLDNPTSVVAADVDHDGAPDLVILNRSTGAPGAQSLVILHNNKNGTFTPIGGKVLTSSIPGLATLQAVAIDVADLNGDGNPDVAVVGSSTAAVNGVGVFLLSAAGAVTATTFTALPATDSGAVALKIVGGAAALAHCSSTPPLDMNADGIPDLVVLSKASGTVTVLVGSGSGTFSLASTVSVGASNPVDLSAFDLDQNGTIDIVVANQANGVNGSITVLTGNGAGALAFFGNYTVPGVGSANFSSVAIGDVNFDCRADIIVSNYNGKDLTLFLGNGDATFSSGVQYNAESSSFAPTANIVAITPIRVSTGIHAIVCADAQTSGPSSRITLVPRHTLNLYTGGFVAGAEFAEATKGIQPQAVAFGDLNGDGQPDMVLVNRASNSVQVFIGDGNGGFLEPFAPIPLSQFSQPESVVIARVDNTSGFPGVLVACNGLNAVALLRNFGGGSLGNPTYIPVDGTGPHQVLIEDANSDGKCDIITVNQASNDLTILLGDGTGNFSRAPGSPFPVGNGPVAAVAADLNGDGALDFAVANFASSDVTVMIRTSATPTYAFRAIPLGSGVNPRSIDAGDLNGDGALDLVTANGDGTITVLHQKLQGHLTLSAVASVVKGDVLTGPPIGFLLGNTPLVSSSYKCTVVNTVSSTGIDVTGITGGGRKLGGEGGTPFAASPLVPTAFYIGDKITDSNTTLVLGSVVALDTIRPSGDFFSPITDYSTTPSPPVVIRLSTSTSASTTIVKLFDLNSDGLLDILVADRDAKTITSLINAGPQIQTASNSPIVVGASTFSFGITQIQAGAVVGGPNNAAVSPSGEFFFINKFSTATIGAALGLDIAHVTHDCPPSTAVVTDDNFIRVFKSD